MWTLNVAIFTHNSLTVSGCCQYINFCIPRFTHHSLAVHGCCQYINFCIPIFTHNSFTVCGCCVSISICVYRYLYTIHLQCVGAVSTSIYVYIYTYLCKHLHTSLHRMHHIQTECMMYFIYTSMDMTYNLIDTYINQIWCCSYMYMRVQLTHKCTLH